jgi:hypothetical protein
MSLQRRGRSWELRRELDAQCRNDLCRQWPDKVDVARGAENTGTSSGKSLKLIALPCPIGDDGYC